MKLSKDGERLVKWVTDHPFSIAKYMSGFAMINILLYFMWVYAATDTDFYTTVRDVGVWAIGITFIYKEVLTVLMILTVPKSRLDRRLIWQYQQVAFLFLYAFVIWSWSHLAVQYSVLFSVIWFNVWMLILWAEGEVLWYTWIERRRYRYHWGRKTFRRLKITKGDSNT